jgi:cyclase
LALKHRIIPILQWDGVQAVKTTQFRRPPRPVGSMMQHIENMQRRDIDELIILDINATKEGREPAYSKIEEYASKLYCPLTVAGGVSELSHIKNLLNAGADKVAIKTATGIIEEACEKFGAQSIVRALDYNTTVTGNYYIEMIKKYEVGKNPHVISPCGEVLLTSIPNEGTRIGYDIKLLDIVQKRYKCPIILNGGCGTPEHMLEAFKAGAHAVAASSMFLFTDTTPKSCARYLHEQGIEVRL